MLTLKIGNSEGHRVETVHDAQILYQKVRDATVEGASTFPSGELSNGLRISYNGRVWDGDTPLTAHGEAYRE